MKKEYNVKSERYGHTHKFVRMPSGYYTFVPEQEWMPIYVTYSEDGNVCFIDTEGGPCIGEGFETDEVKVVAIHGSEFELKNKDE